MTSLTVLSQQSAALLLLREFLGLKDSSDCLVEHLLQTFLCQC